MPPTSSISSVTCAVRDAFFSTACLAVNFPAVTAASMRFVASATNTEMRSAFFAPAIVASDSPAARRERIVATSTPIVVAISSSVAWRSAFIDSLGPIFLPNLSSPRAPAAAVIADLIESACVCVMVPLATSADRTESIAAAGPPALAIGFDTPFTEVRVILVETTLDFDAA